MRDARPDAATGAYLNAVLVVSARRFASVNDSPAKKRNNVIRLYFAENRASRSCVVFRDRYDPDSQLRRHFKQDALLLGFPDRWHEEKTPTKG